MAAPPPTVSPFMMGAGGGGPMGGQPIGPYSQGPSGPPHSMRVCRNMTYSIDHCVLYLIIF